MKYILSLYLFIITFFSLSANDLQQSVNDDLQQVKTNYKAFLLPSQIQDTLLNDLFKIEKEVEVSDQIVVDLNLLYPDSEEIAQHLIDTQNADGSWPDINYADQKRSGWEPKQHPDNALILAKLYCDPKSNFYKSKAVNQCLHKALSYWFKAGLICKNWWYNEIGIPKIFGRVFLLFEDEMTPEEKDEAVKLMSNAKFGMTGQNKVWLAENVMVRAMLENNLELVKAARDTIASEIVTGQEEGIQDDWSYHQHGPQQQFGNYGLAYIMSMGQYYQVFKGTSLQFSDKQISILTNLIKEGFAWTIWNRKMDVSSLDRQLFHKSQVHKGYALAISAQRFGIGGFPNRGNQLVGHKHFDRSDYTIHRTKDWMASLKMSSSRIIGSELINEDNLKGKYLGDGATYFYVTGDEYLNIFPFWYWNRIPGVTSYASPGYTPTDEAPKGLTWKSWSNNTSSKVGGFVKDDVNFSYMELDRDGLKAEKSWQFTDKYVLCKGAGISSDSLLDVTTDVDQRWKNGDLMMLGEDGWHKVDGKIETTAEDVRFYHDHTGYIILGGQHCVAMTEKRQGRWCDFMGVYAPKTVEGEVMEIYIDHGVQPKNGSYLYIVLPASTMEEVENFTL